MDPYDESNPKSEFTRVGSPPIQSSQMALHKRCDRGLRRFSYSQSFILFGSTPLFRSIRITYYCQCAYWTKHYSQHRVSHKTLSVASRRCQRFSTAQICFTKSSHFVHRKRIDGSTDRQ